MQIFSSFFPPIFFLIQFIQHVHLQECTTNKGPLEFCVGENEEYASIQAAIDDVEYPGSKILIRGGTYSMSFALATFRETVSGAEGNLNEICPYQSENVTLYNRDREKIHNDGVDYWHIHSGNGTLVLSAEGENLDSNLVEFISGKGTIFGPFEVYCVVNSGDCSANYFFRIHNSEDVTFEGIVFDGTGKYLGIDLYPSYPNFIVRDCVFKGMIYVGVRVDFMYHGSYDVTFERCSFIGDSFYQGIYSHAVQFTGTGPFANVQIVDSNFTSLGDAFHALGIDIYQISNGGITFNVSGSHFSFPISAPTSTTTMVYLRGVVSITIVDCSFVGYTGSAVYLHGDSVHRNKGFRDYFIEDSTFIWETCYEDSVISLLSGEGISNVGLRGNHFQIHNCKNIMGNVYFRGGIIENNRIITSEIEQFLFVLRGENWIIQNNYFESDDSVMLRFRGYMNDTMIQNNVFNSIGENSSQPLFQFEHIYDIIKNVNFFHNHVRCHETRKEMSSLFFWILDEIGFLYSYGIYFRNNLIEHCAQQYVNEYNWDDPEIAKCKFESNMLISGSDLPSGGWQNFDHCTFDNFGQSNITIHAQGDIPYPYFLQQSRIEGTQYYNAPQYDYNGLNRTSREMGPFAFRCAFPENMDPPDCTECSDLWEGENCTFCNSSVIINPAPGRCDYHACLNQWSSASCDYCNPADVVNPLNGTCKYGLCSDLFSTEDCSFCDPQLVKNPFPGTCEYGVCLDEFEGDNCDLCEVIVHPRQATCAWNDCEDLWSGANCSYCDPSDVLHPLPGTCQYWECLDNWEGKNCSLCPGVVHPHPGICKHGVCSDQWTGDDCSFCDPLDIANPIPGTCIFGNCTELWEGCHCDVCGVVHHASGSCVEAVCEDDWTGALCDYCDNQTVANPSLGTCKRGLCADQWSSDNCSVCASDVLLHPREGTCKFYDCHELWEGKYCSICNEIDHPAIDTCEYEVCEALFKCENCSCCDIDDVENPAEGTCEYFVCDLQWEGKHCNECVSIENPFPGSCEFNVCADLWTSQNCSYCNPSEVLNPEIGTCSHFVCRDQYSGKHCDICEFIGNPKAGTCQFGVCENLWSSANCSICETSDVVHPAEGTCQESVCADEWSGEKCDLCFPIDHPAEDTCIWGSCADLWEGPKCSFCHPALVVHPEGDNSTHTCKANVCADDWAGEKCDFCDPAIVEHPLKGTCLRGKCADEFTGEGCHQCLTIENPVPGTCARGKCSGFYIGEFCSFDFFDAFLLLNGSMSLLDLELYSGLSRIEMECLSNVGLVNSSLYMDLALLGAGLHSRIDAVLAAVGSFKVETWTALDLVNMTLHSFEDALIVTDGKIDTYESECSSAVGLVNSSLTAQILSLFSADDAILSRIDVIEDALTIFESESTSAIGLVNSSLSDEIRSLSSADDVINSRIDIMEEALTILESECTSAVERVNSSFVSEIGALEERVSSVDDALHSRIDFTEDTLTTIETVVEFVNSTLETKIEAVESGCKLAMGLVNTSTLAEFLLFEERVAAFEREIISLNDSFSERLATQSTHSMADREAIWSELEALRLVINSTIDLLRSANTTINENILLNSADLMDFIVEANEKHSSSDSHHSSNVSSATVVASSLSVLGVVLILACIFGIFGLCLFCRFRTANGASSDKKSDQKSSKNDEPKVKPTKNEPDISLPGSDDDMELQTLTPGTLPKGCSSSEGEDSEVFAGMIGGKRCDVEVLREQKIVHFGDLPVVKVASIVGMKKEESSLRDGSFNFSFQVEDRKPIDVVIRERPDEFQDIVMRMLEDLSSEEEESSESSDEDEDEDDGQVLKVNKHLEKLEKHVTRRFSEIEENSVLKEKRTARKMKVAMKKQEEKMKEHCSKIEGKHTQVFKVMHETVVKLQEVNEKFTKKNVSLSTKLEEIAEHSSSLSAKIKEVGDMNRNLGEKQEKLLVDRSESEENHRKKFKEIEASVVELGVGEMNLKRKLEDERLDEEMKDIKMKNRMLQFERSLVGKTFRDFHLVREIGRGANAIVFECKFGANILAMKIVLNLKRSGDTFVTYHRLVEGEFQYKLPIHRNLLRIHHCFVGTYVESVLKEVIVKETGFDSFNPRTAMFITPKCDGTLQDKVNRSGSLLPVFKETSEFLRFVLDVVEGLCVMKSYYLIHCDVKENNIMCLDGTYVVGDYGMCFDFSEQEDPKAFKMRYHKAMGVWGGAFEYKPPELKISKYREDCFLPSYDKYDVYSLGVVCWKMFAEPPTNLSALGVDLKVDSGLLIESACPDPRIRSLIFSMVDVYARRIHLEALREQVRELLSEYLENGGR